jgi:hypothetical protein
MILLSGGTDGGSVSHVVQMAEYIAAARPRARLGAGYGLPVIYAGNRDARARAREVLEKLTVLTVTENIRPTLERENLGPARQEIQKQFLEHVMAHAPGYDRLIQWTDAPIMPTPAAVGEIIRSIARRLDINVIGVDIGGATTDVFSVFGGVFNRTVSANLGMSYSISNVLVEAGKDRVLRWLAAPEGRLGIRRTANAWSPSGDPAAGLEDGIKNKMIRPTTIPQTLPDLMIEQALAREALALAFEQHRSLATGLKGMQRRRDIAEAFEQEAAGSLVNMADLDLLVGSGGVLSHAPRRSQAMMMLIDAFQPEGVTELAVDSIFMMPHLGVLSRVNEPAAVEVFHRDCLVPLGTCVAATHAGRPGRHCLRYALTGPDGRRLVGELKVGGMLRVPAGPGESVEVDLSPARGVDVGAGPSRRLQRSCRGGQAGVVIDARGRPIQFSSDAQERRRQVVEWAQVLDAYPR